MSKISIRVIVFSLLCIICMACGVTRRLEDGQYLLTKMKIQPDKSKDKQDRITADQVKKYIRQHPNKRFLGTNFYAWIYNTANPEKHNWWNNFKRKAGEEPVLLDNELTSKSLENLKIFLNSKGYYSSQVSCEVDTVSKKKKAHLKYILKQNEPYYIGQLSYDCRDRFLEPIIFSDTVNTLLKVGDMFDISVLDEERNRIATFLNDRGYYNFSVKNIEYVADTITSPRNVGVRLIIKQNLTKYDDKGKAVYDNNYVYRINSVNIVPNYNALRARNHADYTGRMDTMEYHGLNVLFYGDEPKMKPKILRQTIPLYPNSLYNRSHINRTYQNIMQTGYFKSARVVFMDAADSIRRSSGYITYMGANGINSDTVKVNYTRESYIDCNIFCTPALKQGFKVDLEGSTTSSFYGLKAGLGYQNRNIFRGAEMLEVEGTIGYEYMKSEFAGKRHAIDLGVKARLTFPRFLFIHTSPVGSIVAPKTKIEISYNHQNRPYYRRDLTGGSIAYSWRNRHNSSFVVRPLTVNWVNVGYIDPDYYASLKSEYLKHSYESQMIFAITGSYVYNYQKLATSANQMMLRVNYEFAGNLLSGLAHMFSNPSSEGYYKVFGIRFSQYARVDASLSGKIMLGKVTAIAGRIYGGLGVPYGNSTAIPFDRMFYAGGSNSMRGWAPRTLGPGNSKLPDDVVSPTQLGDIKLEANLEFRFPIWGIFHGATFFDLGNVWFMDRAGADYDDEALFRIGRFYKQLGFNTGIGIRIDIKFAVLRLDWGIRLFNPNEDPGYRWIHNFKWKNTALNFGIGYPF